MDTHMSKKTPDTHKNALFFFGIAFCLFVLLIITGSIVLYQYQSRHIKQDAQRELSAVADLKLNQIVRWREAHLMNAADIVNDPFVNDNILHWITHHDNATQQKLIVWLRNQTASHKYQNMFLADSSGNQILQSSPTQVQIDSPVCNAIKLLTNSKFPVFSDLHKLTDKDSIHLDIVAPICGNINARNRMKPVAFIVISINPYMYPYPHIQQWPLPSRTSETLLLRKQDTSILYLNELRHRANTALTFALPLNSPHLIAAEALRGKIGSVSGVDYRGKKVLAETRKIPETQWYMVAKTDEEEMYDSLRPVLRNILIADILMILLALFALGMFQRHLAARNFKELYQANVALIESRQRFQSLFLSMTEGVALHEVIMDDLGKPVNYRIIDVNPSFETHTGIPADAARGTVATELYKTDSPPYFDIYTTVAETGKPHFFETYFPALQKHFNISVFSPAPHFFATVFTDTTAAKQAADLLVNEKERLAVTLRSIGDGVITTDTSGNITLLNKAAEIMTEWNNDDAFGKPLTEVFRIICENTRAARDNPVEKVLQTGLIVELANHTLLISRTGRELNIADSGAPIRDRDSNIIGVVLVFRDVTEKQKLYDSMQRSQKLESLGVLAGGIAHDFNNLLFGIFGYIDLTNAYLDQKNIVAAQKSLQQALSVFDRAKALTKQLLTFAKGGMPLRKLTQLKNCIRSSTLFALSGSNITCKLTIAEDLWPCDCDEEQIGQVIDNIVINAKQAMLSGGAIKITADNVTINADHSGNLLHNGNYVRISICDSGKGIPKNIIHRIFDPFFSTKETGHGLGLATVHSIVQRHDGWIDVESEPGTGSSFYVYLPCSTFAMPEEPSVSKTTYTGKGTALIMDDEEFMRDIICQMLTKMGFAVTQTMDGKQAFELWSKAHYAGLPYNVVLLDLTIPGGMGGRDTVAKIRSICPDAIVIASSGYSEDPVMSDPQRFGFNASIVKPYRKEELTDVLTKVFAQKKLT